MAKPFGRNLYFTYPGVTTPALKDFTLSIKPVETLAILGYNGSGTSPLRGSYLG